MKRPNPYTALIGAEQAAEEARETLQDPGLRAAFARLNEHYTQAMRRSAPEDQPGREAAYHMLRALDALARDLAGTVAGVEIARRNYRAAGRHEETFE
jgi:hypothetical protein